MDWFMIRIALLVGFILGLIGANISRLIELVF